MSKNNAYRPMGSVTGYLISLLLGLALYYALVHLPNLRCWVAYEAVASQTVTSSLYKLIWMVMNFTDAQFYAGFFAGLGLLVGAFWAWRLDVRKSPWRGFSISYGTNLWPWVFASQILSMLLVIYFLNYTHLFSSGEYGWLPTFITVVGGPPAIMLLYGPSWITLITSVLLGSLIAFPIAFWFMTKVVTIFEIPVVVGNVLTMAVLGILMCQIFKVLSWIEKKPLPSIEKMAPPLFLKRKVCGDEPSFLVFKKGIGRFFRSSILW
ncbi:MAG TPA: hypothetical protein ENM97_08255 [Moorella mulderi]|nr:hypothetical protein [Moorella mulderi]